MLCFYVICWKKREVRKKKREKQKEGGGGGERQTPGVQSGTHWQFSGIKVTTKRERDRKKGKKTDKTKTITQKG